MVCGGGVFTDRVQFRDMVLGVQKPKTFSISVLGLHIPVYSTVISFASTVEHRLSDHLWALAHGYVFG